MMPLKKGALAMAAGVLLLGANPVQAQDAIAGKAVFDANCAVCHSIQTDVVGPALKDVHKRRDEAWIKKFVKNSTEMIKGGDATAKEVFEKYGKVQMPAFGAMLKDGDIDNVIAYVKQESEAPAAVVAETTPATPDATAAEAQAPAKVAFLDLPPALLMTFALAAAVLLLIVITLVVLFRLFVPMLGDSIYDEDFRASFAGRVLFLMRGDATLFTGKATDVIHSNHDFDGIQEYDNDLPPWWKTMFYVSIVFAIGYMLYYHVFHTGALQEEEYAQEMQQAALFSAKANNDPNAKTDYKVLTDATALENGKKTFIQNCAACHGQEAQGGVGPNLTDEYWLHGGDVNEVFHTVKFGVPAKGMVAWQGKLGKDQILEVSSYILSLQGSNPANAKEPQGEKK
ncbi:c-type cytochrome [Pontibacter liquoris]|uniref:c-type cytochrome n=1 Tax=Pontibacter liquoris TaxID=2905677 RepID=UPI001FA7B288|nr:c-type cytochrome [Pontibacter liquoris]